ncbi:hypothetical protein THOM_1245 [Trachipleistophora hominis]|uniref:Uncharacterized protein n=1 Tax=Trachipleistophora hominis TaxID=72359 RepID=L7JWI8_TRAHO|nr:hypothetical protein THOM_1245 [Trachipleistophora hominis]
MPGIRAAYPLSMVSVLGIRATLNAARPSRQYRMAKKPAIQARAALSGRGVTHSRVHELSTALS